MVTNGLPKNIEHGCKMKIAVCSDLHLEFGDITLKNDQGAEVLILSGDICVAKDLMEVDSPDLKYGHAGLSSKKSKMIHDFFYNCCNEFPHVIYIVGNHEHYHYDFKYTVSHLKKMLKYLPNLQILDTEAWTLHDEVTFIGGTLWTDMNKEDPLTLFHIQQRMNDFRCVDNSNRMVSRKVPVYQENPLYTEDGKNGGKYNQDEKGNLIPNGFKHKEAPSRFCPEDAVAEHKKMLQYIKIVASNLPADRKIVVVGHHTPSPFSVHPKYAHDTLMNGGYHSDLIDFIMEIPRLVLWTHGHTHDAFDYMIGNTRVVCNPRGYINYENCADLFELKYFEV
jgi:predicted phosphodiesterase